ncbi:hypothetical protein Nepgr_029453 [Nepenthes gracilis]|uniref:Pentatricopeptide repeat-containing protein n=1 Tax=Nepenthes gracilis TaxID=150966 RepID=A0AAD3TDL9_NEPGR|nr:hypothetical protein Nepgr_029453 [Nepenthes gracilis]
MTSLVRCVANCPTMSLVESCTSLREIKQIHAQLLINGFLNHPYLLAQFVASIALNHPSNLEYSNHVLDKCECPSLFAFNSMIRAHSKSSTPQKSLYFYSKILQNPDLCPDNYTFTFLVRACAQLSDRGTGPAVHGAAFRRGFENDPHVQSGLIFMYAELGSLDSSRQVFVEIPEPDLVCQTAMVSACSRLGDLSFACELFNKMPQRDDIAWNAMVAGYAQCGKAREALDLFHLMQLEGVKVNEVSMVSVLSACAHLGALDQGRWAHAYIKKNRLTVTVTLGTTLIDMYAKCGNIDKAMEVFWAMKEKNVYTWSSAMGGLALNGAGEKCLELFLLMEMEGVQPNEVTFLSLLRGCSVAGLVEEGHKYFELMCNVYKLKPQLEHYGCMVDLYGRAGHLDKALDVINNMPMKPHAGAWGALLNACRMYRNKELGELASRKIVELGARNHGAYVQLSNIYAESRDWDRATIMRETMKAKYVRKIPGCSLIDVDGEVHEFSAGDVKIC